MRCQTSGGTVQNAYRTSVNKPSQVIYRESLSALKGILALAVHIPCQIPLLRRWAKDRPHLWLMGSTTADPATIHALVSHTASC